VPECAWKHKPSMALAQRRCVLVARVQSFQSPGPQMNRAAGSDRSICAATEESRSAGERARCRWTIGRLQSLQQATRELHFILHTFGADVDSGSDVLYRPAVDETANT
jgi:hypothetical protein